MLELRIIQKCSNLVRLWHKHSLRNYKWHFRLPMSAFATAIWNTYRNINFSQLILRSLNPALSCFHCYWQLYHKLAKFDQNRMIRIYTKFWAFLQKAVSNVKHSDISLAPIWKRFLRVKQFHDAKGFNTRLPSFVIQKIMVVWHMKPE